MTDNNYINFIQFLDNYAIKESVINGEYEVLRKSIRNNYLKMNMNNIPDIECDYEPICNENYILVHNHTLYLVYYSLFLMFVLMVFS